jgi:hypothetical protein
MKKKKTKVLFITFIFLSFNLASIFPLNNFKTSINPALLKESWSAKWICYPEASYYDYGVYHFRKTFNLQNIPDSFIIHISADNRYKLYCNGIEVSTGPEVSDIKNWKFSTINLSPYLKKNKNTLTAVIWNFGVLSPYFQISSRTGFIVQGNSKLEEIANTDESWKCYHNKSYKGIPINPEEIPFFCVVCPGEYVNGNDYPWGWEMQVFNDSSWKKSLVISSGHTKNTKHFRSEWMLTPSSIPPMEKYEERIKNIRIQEGIDVSKDFLSGKKSFVISKNKTVKLLLDLEHLTTAFPVIKVDGGKNAEIKLKYAEGLWKDAQSKGDRNVVEGKKMLGYYDIFISDGGKDRVFSTLYWRAFRYIQIEIKTSDFPITIKDFKVIFNAYPLKERGSFESDDNRLKKIWDAGWRTLRLGAQETFISDAYYEQMQYIGDTRVQALATLFSSGDDILFRNALETFDNSRTADGLTYSRFPSNIPQIIPPYSLDWIGMIHDFWLYWDNSEYIKKFLPGIRSVLYWFETRLNKNYLVGKLPWWEFIDWTETFKDGVPPLREKGESSIISLRLAATLREAADIEEHFGSIDYAKHYRKLSDNVISSVYKNCWDKKREMLADTPEKSSFSQHANIWVILLDVIPENKQKELFTKIISDKNITQCSLYYQFFLHSALKKVGLGDKYLELIKPWYDMVNMGLTTFPETSPESARSDCHPWSSHPVFYLLKIVCGIEPSAPGFKTVNISPYLGNLTYVKGKIPTSHGIIGVNYKKIDKIGMEAIIELPKGLKGTFNWKGKTVELKEGKQTFVIK